MSEIGSWLGYKKTESNEEKASRGDDKIGIESAWGLPAPKIEN